MEIQECEINTDNVGLAWALQIKQHFTPSIKGRGNKIKN